MKRNHSKSKGLTPSEKILVDLCEKTFLNLWSYPNVFRDQCGASRDGDGKEICDLLVVFGDDIIIFSDKSCEMKDDGNVDLNWARWFNRAINKSAKQILGAERWLKTYPTRVFIDKGCKQLMPFPLPQADKCRVHRIVIAIGAREICKKIVGTSGSLQIRPDLANGSHIPKITKDGSVLTANGYAPFSVGWISEENFIHVLDEYTLRTLLDELDTVTDLVGYLTQKEDFIRSGKLEYAEGEEALLYEYIKGGRSFNTAPGSASCNKWETWKASLAYKEERDKLQPSRKIWDGIIDYFAGASLAGRVVPGSTTDLSITELSLRILAAESRLSRKVLSEAFLDRMRESNRKDRMWRMAFSSARSDIGYVFLYYRRPKKTSVTKYRELRKAFLLSHSLVYGYRNSNLKQVVGIATEPGISLSNRTFDLAHLLTDRFTQSENEIAELQKKLGMKDEDFNSKVVFDYRVVPED